LFFYTTKIAFFHFVQPLVVSVRTIGSSATNLVKEEENSEESISINKESNAKPTRKEQ